jgi:hypothetical protein
MELLTKVEEIYLGQRLRINDKNGRHTYRKSKREQLPLY